jgi:hypothetical protein
MRRLTFSLISVVAALGAWGGCASETTSTPPAPGVAPIAGAPPVAGQPPAKASAPVTPGMGTGMGVGMTPPSNGTGTMAQPTEMPPAPPGLMPGEMPPMLPAGTPQDLVDPGTEPWVPVPEAMVGDVCKLDIAMLNSASKRGPLAVVRYGQLCYESTTNDPSAEIWSVTKTLGAVTTGMAMYQTRDIAGEGPKMGKLDQFDRADKWLDSVSFNRDALLAHVLAMEAQNGNLETGLGMMYDTVGTVQINRLSDVVNAAIGQDSMRLGANIEEFFQKFVVQKLGLENSTWSGGSSDKVYAYTWDTTLRDMGRVGLLELNGGIYNKERLLTPNYVYNMGHVSFESGSNAYGYLTWMGGDSCAPVPVHRKYPHGASSATDCGSNCDQMYDVGAFYAGGMGGQFIQVHRGLDMVILGKNWGEGNIQGMWAAVRPSLVAMDEMFKGDEAAFCTAYGAGNYAPDLKLWEGEDPVMGGLDSPPIK